MATAPLLNPFRPGAGHMPPYLAGREDEKGEFARLLNQTSILDNLVLTGLRGVGKTVLLDALKPPAREKGWLWVGNDLSETSSGTEANLSTRLLADLAVATSNVAVSAEARPSLGLRRTAETAERKLDFETLSGIWNGTPGLASDKLKAVLDRTWEALQPLGVPGIVFAYDEAQNLADHPGQHEHPLSLLLDVFQSVQRKGTPYMLVLAGLPTLFPKLVEARTFAERMFRVVMLDRLSAEASAEAIVKPIEESGSDIRFMPDSVRLIYEESRGYPYFIQYFCREAFDIWTFQPDASIPIGDILRKLDDDFFAGRWARATDRQRDLLVTIAGLDNASREFTVQEIVRASADSGRPFQSSHVNRMLAALGEAGLVYKNRWGRYSLAVPLLDAFIRRQMEQQRQQTGP